MWVYKGVEVRTHDRLYTVIKMISDVWVLLDTWWYLTIDEILELKLSPVTLSSITPIPNPPKLLPVGTKVRVFEEYSKDANLEYIVRLQKYDSYSLEESPGVNIQRIPARAVVPVLE